MKKEKNKTSQDESLEKVSFVGRAKLRIRRIKNIIKSYLLIYLVLDIS